MANPFATYRASKRYNEELARMQQELWDNLKIQIGMLSEQRKQMLASANQDIVQRKMQGYRTQQATIARQLAMGLGAGGGTLSAIQGNLQQAVAQDVGIIQSNLANYLAQTQYQQQLMQRETMSLYSQYESQKRKPGLDALEATLGLVANIALLDWSKLGDLLSPLLLKGG